MQKSLGAAESCGKLKMFGGAVAQLGARLDGIEEVVGSNPIGKDLGVAHTALIGMDYGQPFEAPTAVHADPPSTVPSTIARKTVGGAAREYIERSKQKSRKTYLGSLLSELAENSARTYPE